MQSTRHGMLRALSAAALLVPVSFIAGALFSPLNNTARADISCTVSGGGTSQVVDLTAFWRAWQLLDQKYVSPTNNATTSLREQHNKRLWGAIEGMVASVGDPYTEFLPPSEKKLFEQEIHGSFGGVGMELGVRKNAITVIAALPNTPAARAGIRAGDRVLRIGDLDAEDLSMDKAISLIRGEVGTKVTITFARENVKDPLTITLTRAVISIPIIDHKELGGGIYYIRLFSFSENSPELFRQALLSYIKSGDTRLILDLRGNPGGYLDASVDIASWFLPQGATVVREQIGPEKRELAHRSVRSGVFSKNLLMVVLIDKGSASASEILAGALKEYGIATLVGEQTFGKGSVQELVPVTSDTSLKVTVARWLTPNGVSISERGLKPDYTVTISEADRQALKDPQLDKAISLLKAR